MGQKEFKVNNAKLDRGPFNDEVLQYAYNELYNGMMDLEKRRLNYMQK